MNIKIDAAEIRRLLFKLEKKKKKLLAIETSNDAEKKLKEVLVDKLDQSLTAILILIDFLNEIELAETPEDLEHALSLLSEEYPGEVN